MHSAKELGQKELDETPSGQVLAPDTALPEKSRQVGRLRWSFPTASRGLSSVPFAWVKV
jgi:hypothetical protein